MIKIFITERKKSLYKSLLLSEGPEDEKPAEDEGGEEGNFVDEESMDDEGFGGEEGSDDTSGDTSSMGGGDTGEVDPTLKLTKTKKRKLILLKQYEELDKLLDSYIKLLNDFLPTIEDDNKYDILAKQRIILEDLKEKIKMIIFTDFIKEELYILIKDFYICKSIFYSSIKIMEKNLKTYANKQQQIDN